MFRATGSSNTYIYVFHRHERAAPLKNERDLRPAQDGLAVEEFEDSALYCQWAAVRHHHGCDDRIAAIVEGNRQGRPAALGSREIRTTAALHPGDTDRM